MKREVYRLEVIDMDYIAYEFGRIFGFICIAYFVYYLFTKRSLSELFKNNRSTDTERPKDDETSMKNKKN